MQTRRPLKFLNVMLFAAMLSLPLAAVAGSAATQNSARQAQANEEPVMQLGKVTVKGEKRIVETLQEIKVALRRPESSDPKMQNMVVCRLTNDIGSHANQILTCATNRTLAMRRQVTQLGFLTPIPAGGGERARISVLNEYLTDLPSNILHVPINGPAFRTLLEKIPLPAPATATAPSAATHH